MKALPLVLAAGAALLPALSLAAPITITGVVRDFRMGGTTGGHTDFEDVPIADDRGIVATSLGADGKPVYAGGSHPTVESGASFYQWYHDVAGVNSAMSLAITLDDIGGGLYQFSSNSFFPADGLLFGNQGYAHNYGFTTEFHTTFTFVEANSSMFSFSGDDDVFVFINGVLALDLGGVHGVEFASIDINSFAAANGLLDGSDYSLDVFHAERHTVDSNFTITTSLKLVPVPTPVPEPGSLALLAFGGALLGLARRRNASLAA